ncbi:MAG: cation:proton antiporter [Methanocalculaceae archaeon]|jgi:CPA2 family monovalent cation:H+ antiporter-2|nr:cation:proton antiporter [Methanocalculaceae archaeon]
MAVESPMMGIFFLLVCTLGVLLCSSWVRLPTIIGFFVTGILIGPSVLHLFAQDQVELVAEFGLILLMFTIGLEISLKNLLAMKRFVLIGGSLQILLTALFVWLVLLSEISSGTALLLGFMVASSSTAIVLNMYQSNGQIDTLHGKLILAILICQDVAVIPIMLILPLITENGRSIMDSLLALGRDIAGLIIVLGVALIVIPRLLDVVASRRNRELFIISVVAICIGVASVLSLVNVSMSLGAFLAGVVIAGTEYNHEVLGIITPIRDLLTGIFFISIGMMLSLTFMQEHILVILIIVGVLIFGKMIIASISGVLAGVSAGAAVIAGLSLAHIGEFSFILGAEGRSQGLLTENSYQVFLAVAILSMTIAPFAVNLAPRVSRLLLCSPVFHRCCPRLADANADVETDGTEERESVIVVGFGPAGNYVVRALKRVGREYIILEMNPGTVAAEKMNGENIAYGDASFEPILRYAGLERAKTLVITIPDSSTVRGIVSTARRMNPRTTIITRTRYTGESPTLFRIGVDEVIADEREAGLAMARRVFANENVPAKDLDQYVQEVRSEVFAEREEAMAQIAEESRLRRISAKFGQAPKTEIAHVPVHPSSEVAGKELANLHLRKLFRVSVVSLRRISGEVLLTPDGTTVLLPHDTAILSGRCEDIAAARQAFGKKKE